MTYFDNVTLKLGSLEYMKEDQAHLIRDFIHAHDISEVLEIGFFKGKSSAYFAAVLEDMGKGHLTTLDKKAAEKYSPSIFSTLELVGLRHRVTPIFADRSHTWELGKMVSRSPRPQFDMCYFDGGHTWDVTGFGFILVDMLLKPGGWIVFDDLNWTISASVKRNPSRSKSYTGYGKDEMKTSGVRMVFENIVPHLGYINLREEGGWGFAQKPMITDFPSAT